MKNQKQSKRGITLIALVITIIVLLILAGVSIALIQGENKIFLRAETATEKTKMAMYQEQLEMIIARRKYAKKN